MKKDAKEKPASADIFLTTSVTLTGFDKAYSGFDNGRFHRLSVQIKPYYFPTENWITRFHEKYLHSGVAFTLSQRGIGYITFHDMTIKADELDAFVSSLLAVIEGINEATGNEPIVTVISAGECAQAEHPEINACMNRIDFSLQGAR